MKIAVYGSGDGNSPVDVMEKAFDIGELIAKEGAVLVTGGCGGLPYEAAKGAAGMDGMTIGFSPAKSRQDHIERFKYPFDAYKEFRFVQEDISFSPQAALKYRNVISCNESDGCIIVGGRIGTLNEFTIMFDMGKVIGVLEGTGGITGHLQKIIDVAQKDTGAIVIFDEDPETLVKKVIEEIKNAE